MKLLELYINKNGPHRFICVDGLHRSDLPFTGSDTDTMLAEAVRIIEGDQVFDERIRIYDAHGICLKGDVTRYVTLASLKRWTRHEKQPLAA